MLLAIAVSFILVRGTDQLTTGPDISMDVALAKRDVYGSDFLWFKKDGREYLIRDTKTLDRVGELFEKARPYKVEAKKLKHQMKEGDNSESERESLERRRDELSRKYHEARAEAEQAMLPILDDAIRKGTATPIR